MPLSTLVVLGAVILAFIAFGVTLFGASLYVAVGRPSAEKPVARQVTQATRSGALQR
jgi:hypothetical protein